MPFPRKQRGYFLNQLFQARYRSPDVIRALLDNERAAAARKKPSWLTGTTHSGVFYRIRIPPPPAKPRLPRLPQLYTPTSPPLRLPTHKHSVGGHSGTTSTSSTSNSTTTAATSASHVAKAARPRVQHDTTANTFHILWWDSLYEWWRENGPTLVLNFGSVCTLIGFTRTDVLELRALSVTGSLCAVVYHFCLQPLRIPPIVWSFTFAAVNSYKIYEILVERQGSVNLTQEQQERYIHFFMPHGVTPKQFELIQQKAHIMHVPKGTILIQQNDELHHVYLVVSGSTRASVLGRHVTAISITNSGPLDDEERIGGGAGGRSECGAWIGEMSLLERVWLQEQGKQQQTQQTQTATETPPVAAATTLSSPPNKQPVKSESNNGAANGDKKVSDDTTSKPSLLLRKQSPPPLQQSTQTVTPNGNSNQHNNNQLKASHSMYTIVAAEDCLVLRWSHEDLQTLMAKSTDMRAALTRAMTAAVVGKVIQFTVSRSKTNNNNAWLWSSWLQDWKHNAGASVQVSTSTTTSHAEEDDNDEEDEETPPRENLPSYAIQRFR